MLMHFTQTWANESWAIRCLVSFESSSWISITVWLRFNSPIVFSSRPLPMLFCRLPSPLVLEPVFRSVLCDFNAADVLLNSFKNGSLYDMETLTLLGRLPPSRCRDETDEYFLWRELCWFNRLLWPINENSPSNRFSLLAASTRSCKEPPCVWRFGSRFERDVNRYKHRSRAWSSCSVRWSNSCLNENVSRYILLHWAKFTTNVSVMTKAYWQKQHCVHCAFANCMKITFLCIIFLQ